MAKIKKKEKKTMKTQTITIRVSALEKLRIEQEAQKREMNVSEYIRYIMRREQEL